LKNVTIFGAGLLIGTALAVIIPEGVNALYSDRPRQPRPSLPTGAVGLTADQVEHIGHEHSDGDEFSSTIGLSLVLGFIFMLLVDQISSRRSENTSSMTATIGLVVHAAAE
jgi:solute carrier family 39 (zinc transporter), member 9